MIINFRRLCAKTRWLHDCIAPLSCVVHGRCLAARGLNFEILFSFFLFFFFFLAKQHGRIHAAQGHRAVVNHYAPSWR